MKKSGSLALVIAMVLSVTVVFSACGNNNSVYTPFMPQMPAQPTVAPTEAPAEAATESQKPSLPIPKPTLPVQNVTEPVAKPTEPKVSSIVGEWTAEVDLSPILNLVMEAQVGKAFIGYVTLNDFEVEMTFEFDDYGNYKMSLDKRSAERAYDRAFKEWEEGLTQLVQDIIDVSGENYTVDEVARETFGMTIEEYLSIFAEQIDFNNLENSGVYELDGDRLYMDNSKHYYTVRLTEDELEFVDYSDSDTIDMKLFKNVEFERQ